MSLTWLEAVLIVLVLILLTYIYFRGMHPMVEIRSNNGLPVKIMHASSMGYLSKMISEWDSKKEYKPVYFPDGYIFKIENRQTNDEDAYFTIMG